MGFKPRTEHSSTQHIQDTSSPRHPLSLNGNNSSNKTISRGRDNVLVGSSSLTASRMKYLGLYLEVGGFKKGFSGGCGRSKRQECASSGEKACDDQTG